MRKVIRTLDYPIVATKCGRVHGFEDDGILTFLGIPYARAGRYELPQTFTWDGVRAAKSYSRVCPLLPEQPTAEDDPRAAPESDFEMPHVYWPVGEDCLSLNIWTKKTDPSGKKPVMVWLHGGGFCAGSSIEQPAYNGHNLCDQQDVVVVTLNHRLNCLGFLDLSSFGEQYQYTGCLGMADIVAALRWVHDSIAQFGGDPENVTIFGQSGGGNKVITLMQMPGADHLYRRGIIESPGLFQPHDKDVQAHKKRCQQLGEAVVEALGLTADTLDQIKTIPYERIEEASVKAAQKLGKTPDLMLFEPAPVDGLFPGNWYHVGFRKEIKDTPLIIGTTMGEFFFQDQLGDKTRYNEEDKQKLLSDKFGTHARRIEELFRETYPDKDILYARSTDSMFRPPVLEFAKAYLQVTNASVYNYIFTTTIPYLGSSTPWHCAEIPFVFCNTDTEKAQCTGYAYKDHLEKVISTAWANFARTGNPSSDLAQWDPYRPDDYMVMHFDEESRQEKENDVPLLQELSQAYADMM